MILQKNRLLIAEQIKRQALSLQNETNILPDCIFLRDTNFHQLNTERAFALFISRWEGSKMASKCLLIALFTDYGRGCHSRLRNGAVVTKSRKQQPTIVERSAAPPFI